MGLIEKQDTDDRRKTDQDYYLISRHSGDDESKFINHLAFYINNICSSPILPEHKNDLLQLIEDFKISKDLGPVEKLIEPYIQ